MNNNMIEIILIISMCFTVPTLAVAAWHGWQFEKQRAQNREEESEFPWN